MFSNLQFRVVLVEMVKYAGVPPVMYLHTKFLPERLPFHQDKHKLHVSDSLSRLLPYSTTS